MPGVVYPPSDDYTNARNYFSRLNGQLFRTRGYAADGRLVRESHTYPYVVARDNSDQRIVGTFTRIRKQTVAGTGELFPSDPSLRR